MLKTKSYFISICILNTVYSIDPYSKYNKIGRAAVIDANGLWAYWIHPSQKHTHTGTEIIDLECLRPIGTAGLFSYCATINTRSKPSIYHLHWEPLAHQAHSHTPSSESPLQTPSAALGLFFLISWLVTILKARTVIELLLRSCLQALEE